MKKIITLVTLAIAFIIFAKAETFAQKDKEQSKIVFKVPEGVFPMDWNKNNFRGMLMLEKDSPSGMFITYPNDNEETEDLKKRAIKFIFPMFSAEAKDEEYGKDETKWNIRDIPAHKGDKGEFGKYYLLENDKQVTQIIVYERESAGKTLIYGYFASRKKDDKINKKKWADDEGNGVKLFKKFWESFK